MNDYYCRDCFNFKMVDVTTGNLHYLKFETNKIVQKEIKRDKHSEVTVYYCKKGLLPKTVYLIKQYALNIINPNCESCEYLDV
jgi:hypothetical protein